MSYRDLLNWITSGRAFEAQPDEVLRLVDTAFEGLDEDDPRYQLLLDIESALLVGEMPTAELLALARDHGAGES